MTFSLQATQIKEALDCMQFLLDSACMNQVTIRKVEKSWVAKAKAEARRQGVTMTIRDVPREVHAHLKARARKNRRSLNQQVIADLSQVGFQESLEERSTRVEREIFESEQLRARTKGFLTAGEIDAAKREGLA